MLNRSARAVRRHLGAVVALTAVITVGCSSGDHGPGPTLKAPTDGTVGGEIPLVTAGVPVVVPMQNLCTSGGDVTITDIQAADPTTGMRLVDWGTRRRSPNDDYGMNDNIGGATGRVSQFRGFGHHRVGTSCGTKGESTELDVSLATSRSRGTITGLRITYDSAGRTRTLVTSFDLALCTTRECPPLRS